MSDEEFRLPKVTVFDHTVDGYLQLNAFYNYVVKREAEILEWQKRAKLYDEEGPLLRDIIDENQELIDNMTDKLEAVNTCLKRFQFKRDEIYELRERERNRPKSHYQPLGTSPMEATLNDILEAYDFILKELRQILEGLK